MHFLPVGSYCEEMSELVRNQFDPLRSVDIGVKCFWIVSDDCLVLFLVVFAGVIRRGKCPEFILEAVVIMHYRFFV